MVKRPRVEWGSQDELGCERGPDHVLCGQAAEQEQELTLPGEGCSVCTGAQLALQRERRVGHTESKRVKWQVRSLSIGYDLSRKIWNSGWSTTKIDKTCQEIHT